MLDLQHRPRLQRALHWFFALCGLILAAQGELPKVFAFFPEGSVWPKYAGYLLGLAAFSSILGQRAGLVAAPPAPAAPEQQVPASEAITAVIPKKE